MSFAGTGNLGYNNVGGAGGGIIIVPPVPQQGSAMDISGLAGNTINTWKSFTFVVFDGTIDIDGETFGAGTYTYGNGDGTMLPMSYDATAGIDAKIMIQI